ncbi:rhodanese-like domain-containing protein [Myxococcus landrumensis]|uniref:Rhodanese-like domain-containing protein n=1 Tax=Myxococcus landrumensis TaxID=2813577 RepID=A0ABX7MXT6_9BACT|nr:rhodanese-like domain-containing protein [Myxococcus landrumus]QSQ11234.1 rhodanese-like domain-containing protein [Myxococcus landrumus]
MKLVLVAVAVLAGVLGVACTRERPEVRAEAHKWVESGALLLDVRTPEEFAEGHLPGALNIPVDLLSERLGELGSPETPVVVYCRSGKRSTRAETLLKERGFQQVLNLGPMSAWE